MHFYNYQRRNINLLQNMENFTNQTFDYEYDDDYYIPYSQRPETYFVPVIFLLIIIAGVLGNGTLIFILLRHAKMRNVPNTYVLSLAIGDLLVIVTCVPFTSIIYTLDSWPWGTTICKVSEFVKDISIGVSVFTLAALSAERYCAIVNPIRRHVAGLSAKPVTVLVASIIWILAIIFALPAVLFSHVPSVQLYRNYSIFICSPFPEEFGEDYKKGLILFKFLTYYAIPLCIIAAFYLSMARHLMLSTTNMPGEQARDNYLDQINARRRVGKMVVSFIIVFFICFLPIHAYNLWFHFCPTAIYDYNYFWHYFRIFGFCLSFINSCVNPIALYLISRTFRKRFNKYLCICTSNGIAAGRKNRISSSRNHDDSALSRRNLNLRSTLRETSFIINPTIRRRTQDSTEVFEPGGESFEASGFTTA
ncbi:neuropeptide CCHamide-2 receptor-like isoform X2 [Pseudomyrmex gracilis]|uniref:neuropeptide CCHamide-2 receptor-like isoform X2 n=1 Tax=Pseudomyrmex gracilis TaxID=219809 RepID=UPI00099491F0|nr:neuropeptide CCHamide-2 receptor-like isoform X2 [Pseudomyrmex gracilis]